MTTAVDKIFDTIRETGRTRETSYDEEFVARKQEALREAGWTLITLAPTTYSTATSCIHSVGDDPTHPVEESR